MFRFLITLILALLWSPGGASNSIDSTAGESHRLLVFGDSLSDAYGIDRRNGWVALLRERLAEREGPDWTVRNASISGETTAGGKSRLPELLETEVPDVVILQLGGNDGLRGLSLRAFRENLEVMLDAIAAAGAEVLLAGIQIPPNYGPVYTERFRRVFADLAEDRDLAFVSFLLEGVALDPDLMLEDGIHPRAEAQPRILENIWEGLDPVLQRVEGQGEVPQEAASALAGGG